MARPGARGPFTLVYSADHGNDLPPKWDGAPILWDEWTLMRTTLPLHLPTKDLACTKCGSTQEREHSVGRRAPSAKGRQAIWLYVERCPDCLQDTVWDPNARQLWDLEVVDYGDEGSVA